MDLFYKSIIKKNKSKNKGKSNDDIIQQKLDKKINSIRKVFKQTKFGKKIEIVCITANRNGNNAPGQNEDFDHNINEIHKKSDNIQILIDKILDVITIPNRQKQFNLPFLAAVDHCFSIKGQGTILTCTILQGSLSLHQIIEIPNFKEQRKIRSIECYKNNVSSAIAGDRVSISIAQFSSKKLNRGLICTPNTVPMIYRTIARCDRIRYFKETVKSGSKFHITIGHSTSIATIQCFRKPTNDEIEKYKSDEKNMEKYKMNKKVNESEEKQQEIKDNSQEVNNNICAALDWENKFRYDMEYLCLDELDDVYNDNSGQGGEIKYETYILLSFNKPVCCAKDSLLIGSRFDNADLRKDVCRLGFAGKIVAILPPPRIISMTQYKQEVGGNNVDVKMTKKQIKALENKSGSKKKKNKDKIDAELQCLKIYKPKMREGKVDKFIDGYTGIGTDMFQKGTDISLFVGLKVELDTRFHEVGVIDGSFGDSGNFYIKFKNKVKRKRSEKWKPKVYLKSKKFLYQKSKVMTQ